MFKEYKELEFESRNELICTASNTTLATIVISRKANVTERIDIRRSQNSGVRGPACQSILSIMHNQTPLCMLTMGHRYDCETKVSISLV